MADERVRIVVEAQDKATSVLRGITDSASSFSKAMNAAMTLGGITTAIAAVGVAVNKALDFGAAGASLINLEQSFTNFATSSGQNADLVLSSMKQMSNGMLSEADAMQQYNRAYLLMGEEMAAKMPELIQVATAASAAGMGDFNFLLNSLVVGLGRSSPLILDNLGFTVKLSDAYDAYAQSVGKSANELSKAEQQQALLNAVMADAEKKFGDLDKASGELAGAGIAQLRAARADLNAEMQKLPAPAIDAFAGGLAYDLRTLTPGSSAANEEVLRGIEQLDSGISGLFNRIGAFVIGDTLDDWAITQSQLLDVAAMSAEEFADAVKRVGAVSPAAAADMHAVRNEALGIASDVTRADQRLLEAADAFRAMGAGARAAQIDMKGLNGAIGAAITLVGNLNSAARGAQGSLAGMATDLRVSMMKAQDYARGIEKPQLDWFTTGKKPWEMPEAVADYGRALGTYIENQGRQVWSDHEASITSAGAAYGGLTDSMESYYDAWKSKADSIASSILSPTQDVDLAAMEEKLYGRKDAFDENARRAMDVFEKGTDSPWAAQLGLGSKEDAFQYIKDFYAGKLPEDQYNWGSAIGQYQDQMEQSIGADSLQKMFEEKLVGAGWGPEGAALTDALQAPMGDGGTAAAETFAGTFTAYGWVTPGTTAAEMILTGLRQRLEKGDSKLNSGIEALVIRTVKNFIGAGGELP